MLLKHVYSLKVIFHALELVEITVYVYLCYIMYVFETKLAFHTENGFTSSSVCYIFVVPLNHKYQHSTANRPNTAPYSTIKHPHLPSHHNHASLRNSQTPQHLEM